MRILKESKLKLLRVTGSYVNDEYKEAYRNFTCNIQFKNESRVAISYTVG